MQTVNQSGRPKDLEKRARILQAAKAIFLKSGGFVAQRFHNYMILKVLIIF